MVEHRTCNAVVIGSNPIAGSTFMEEEYEQIDKIVNRVLENNNAVTSKHMLSIFRELSKESLNEGYKAGYELGYEAGYDIGYCEGAGVTDLKAKYGNE